MLNSSIVISPLVLFCFQGRLIKQFGELITFFLPIQVPPRTGSLCDFTENSLHRLPDLSSWLENELPEGFAVFNVEPDSLNARRKFRTTNMAEFQIRS